MFSNRLYSFSHLQLVDEDRDLQSHLLVILHHQVVGEGGAVDPVHHQHVYILHPEQGTGQLLHPGRLTAQGPAEVKGSRGRITDNSLHDCTLTCSYNSHVYLQIFTDADVICFCIFNCFLVYIYMSSTVYEIFLFLLDEVPLIPLKPQLKL